MAPEVPEVKQELGEASKYETPQQALGYLEKETGIKFQNLQALLEEDKTNGFNHMDGPELQATWFKPHIEKLKALLNPNKTIIPVTAADLDSVFFRGDKKYPTDAVKRGLLRWQFAYFTLIPDNLSHGPDKQVAQPVKEVIQTLGFAGLMEKASEWCSPESISSHALHEINFYLKEDPTQRVTAEEIIRDAKTVAARLRLAHQRKEAEEQIKAEEAIDGLK